MFRVLVENIFIWPMIINNIEKDRKYWYRILLLEWVSQKIFQKLEKLLIITTHSVVPKNRAWINCHLSKNAWFCVFLNLFKELKMLKNCLVILFSEKYPFKANGNLLKWDTQREDLLKPEDFSWFTKNNLEAKWIFLNQITKHNSNNPLVQGFSLL